MYRGRFAPSPSGPLHFGSLVAALASYLEARSHAGEWLLRIDDIDTARVVPGAADEILYSLDAYGFTWDGAVLYQSARVPRYQQVLSELHKLDLVYRCACSRREIAAIATTALDGGKIYPGTCRYGVSQPQRTAAWRLRTDDALAQIEDALQGVVAQRLESEIGDFIVQRADGMFSYQLAVVIDDADQGVTDIVRGCDLLDSTPRQRYVQQCLGFPCPIYSHIPIIVDEHGDKLSKQTAAPALNNDNPGPALYSALCHLRQTPPAELARATIQTLWQWALRHWCIKPLVGQRKLFLSEPIA